MICLSFLTCFYYLGFFRIIIMFGNILSFWTSLFSLFAIGLPLVKMIGFYVMVRRDNVCTCIFRSSNYSKYGTFLFFVSLLKLERTNELSRHVLHVIYAVQADALMDMT